MIDLCRNCATGVLFFLNVWFHFLVSFQNTGRVGFFPSFHFRLFDRIPEIAAFRYLILIYFMDYSSDIDANFPCLCRRLLTRFLSLPAERCLRSAAAAIRQRSVGCEYESAFVPAALPPPLHAGVSWAIGHSAEPAARLGLPIAWSTRHGLRVEHNSKCSCRHNNQIPAN